MPNIKHPAAPPVGHASATHNLLFILQLVLYSFLWSSSGSNRNVQVVGEDLPYSLPFSKTIFLLEDVDAACDVVQRRSPAARASPARKASTFGRRSASPAVEDSEGSPVRPGSPRPGSDSDGGAVWPSLVSIARDRISSSLCLAAPS